MGERKQRTYSAKERAAKNGAKNPAEERTERELRQRLITEHGEPAFYRITDGVPSSITKISPPFFAGLYNAKHDVLWEPEEQRFYDYEASSGLWRVMTEEKLVACVRSFMLAESRRNEITKDSPTLNMEERLSLKLDSEVVFRLKATAEKRDAFKRDTDFTLGEHFIHFANGVFVLRDGKPAGFVKGFSKWHYSRNRCPVIYDPKAECPRFVNEFLLPALCPETAQADMDLLFAFIGFGLLGFNVLQKILILQGASQSGKSTFGKLVALLVGEENTAQLRTHLLHERFELGSFIGRTLLLGADVNPKFFLSPGAEVLKALTGGDLMQAELKQGNARPTFYGTFNVIVATNDELKIKMHGDRDAWERRLVLVPFQKHTPKRVIRHFERLLVREEGSGIVNRALDAVMACLAAGGLALNLVQRRRVLDMLDRSDPVQEFVLDRIEKKDGGSLTKKDIREAFKKYCHERRWSVPSDRDIGSRLPQVMKELFGADESNSVPDFADHAVQGYRGVAWRTD
ncbi:MAG: phage/plasmid primase, P4 family [Prosthecobacter sp.]